MDGKLPETPHRWRAVLSSGLLCIAPLQCWLWHRLSLAGIAFCIFSHTGNKHFFICQDLAHVPTCDFSLELALPVLQSDCQPFFLWLLAEIFLSPAYVLLLYQIPPVLIVCGSACLPHTRSSSQTEFALGLFYILHTGHIADSINFFK